MPIPALCLGAALVVGLTPVRSAAAFELFGLSFFSSESNNTDSSEMIGEPVAFEARLEVADQSGPEQVDRTTLLAASRVLNQLDEQPISLPGLLAEARADYRRILGALYTEGRYGGDVLITANGQEISALPADAELAEPISLVVSVDPGPVYRFGTLDIVGPAPETSDRRDQVPGFADLGFVPGAVASSIAIRQAEAAIVEG